MDKLFVSAAVVALSGGLVACNYNKEYNNAAYANEAYGNEAYAQGGANYSEGENAAGGGNYAANTAAGNWPTGSRIVVDNGVTYRIEPGGARIALGPNESRIVVEDGVRYRVDPSGTRIRIDPNGAEISVGPAGTTLNVSTNTQ